MDNSVVVWAFGAFCGAIGTVMTAFFSGKVVVGRSHDEMMTRSDKSNKEMLELVKEELALERKKNAALEARLYPALQVGQRAIDAAAKVVDAPGG